MKSCEAFVSPESEYFVYTPSRSARELFFYPLQCGHFIYEAGYSLYRESYDSFLLMYITDGAMTLQQDGASLHARAGDFLLLDCYRPHAYSTETGWECLWCHFDGPLARSWYEAIFSRTGCVYAMPQPCSAYDRLSAICDIFALGKPASEPLMSKYLTDILTAFLLYTPSDAGRYGYMDMSEKIITYINEHFRETVTVEELAAIAGLSQFHFIRAFKKETGFTPHEYILDTRFAAAKYLLKNSVVPIKDICFRTGFCGESVFCTAFRRRYGMTPLEYRRRKGG